MPQTWFVFWDSTHQKEFDTSEIVKLSEPPDGTNYTWSISVARNSTFLGFTAAVTVYCDQLTALSGLDYICDEKRFVWNINETTIYTFNIIIKSDADWEHDEVFYIKLKDGFNGRIKRAHRSVTLMIPTNDHNTTCGDSIEWTHWTDCVNETYGTGVQTRSRDGKIIDPVTKEVTCQKIIDTKQCYIDKNIGMPSQILVSNNSMHLLEDDVDFKMAIISYRLGGMPQFDKYKDVVNNPDEMEAYEGCVVKADIDYDDSLDVHPNITYLCWTNNSWAKPIAVEFHVDGNDEVDSTNPRVRIFKLSKYVNLFLL